MKNLLTLTIILLIVCSCKKRNNSILPVNKTDICKQKISSNLEGIYLYNNQDTITIIYSSTKCEDSNYNYYSVKNVNKIFTNMSNRAYKIEVNETIKESTYFLDSILVSKGTKNIEDYFIISQLTKKYYLLKKL